jgi:WD40 repeat protein
MSGDLKHEIAHMGPHGFTAAFSPDSRVFATGAEELRLYDAATGKLIKSITAGHRSIRRVAFTPDGKRIVASSDWARPIATGICLESEVQLWDIATGKALYTIKDLNPWLMSLAISPDGQTLATGSEGPFQERHAKPRCEVCLWKIDNGERLQSLRLDGTRPYGMAFSPDGKTLAIATTEQVVIADPQTLKVRSQLFKTTHTPRWDKARIEIRPKQ